MAQSQGVLGCETVGSNRAKQVCTHTTERTAVVSFSVRYDGLICVFYLGCVCVLCSDDNDVISPVILGVFDCSLGSTGWYVPTGFGTSPNFSLSIPSVVPVQGEKKPSVLFSLGDYFALRIE